jgi:hypothetical protein
MSLNKLTSQAGENKFLNPRINTLVIDHGVDLKGSDIKNVGLINGIPFGGIVVKPESIIIYRQGSGPHVPLTNIYGTWSEVKNVILVTSGAVIIYIDDSLGVPLIDSNTDFQCRCRLVGCPSINKPSLKIQDFVIISNLASIEGMFLVGSFTTIVPLQYSQGFVLSLSGGSSLKFDGISSKPFLELIGSQFFVLTADIASNLDNSLSPLTPLINLTSTSGMIIVASLGSTFSNNFVTGSNTSGINYIVDASITIPSTPGMLGTVNVIRLDNAIGVNYTDSSPLLLANDIQGAIDALKLSSNISYNDSVLPAYGTSTVQASLDAIKPLLGGTNSYCSVGFNANSGPSYVVMATTVPVTNITSPYTNIDNKSGISPDSYGIIIPNGTYRINWSVAFDKSSNNPSYFGVMYTDLLGVPVTISSVVAYDNSLLSTFTTISGETYLTNSSGNQYVQLYVVCIGGNIAYNIYYWNLSVQSI